MVIVINSVIEEFGWMDLVWLAARTDQLQVSNYSQLSDYNYMELVVKNKAPNALIVCEEMVLVMIRLILWSLVYINFHLLCW